MQRAMFTDLYAFTMAAAYVQSGRAERPVTCELFVRRLPRRRRFMVAAGLEEMVRAMAGWRLDDEDLAYLREVPALREALTPAVVERLQRLSFTGDAWAMPEGTVFFPDEPVLRVTAPILEAQLLETYLLSVFNQASSVASKAARVMLAARGKPVVDFGMRRIHPDAALSASRAAVMMGLQASSNVAAGRAFGLPLTGTMAHAFVMVHDTEEEAFRAFLRTYPKGPTFLVDTYDSLEGVRHAIAVAGPALGGVRLDSGDLAGLSRAARAILDQAGLPGVKIVASGDLDEHKIAALEAAGAPVDVYAVGTELAASADAPTLGAIYKVVHDHEAGRPVAKFSANKATHAGVHQVLRRVGADGKLRGDVLALEGEPADGAEALLQPVVRAGRPLAPPPSLEDSRRRAAAELARLPDVLKDLSEAPRDAYPVSPSAAAAAATEAARRHFMESVSRS